MTGQAPGSLLGNAGTASDNGRVCSWESIGNAHLGSRLAFIGMTNVL